MSDITLEFIGEQLARIIDEQRALRIELRRLSENQMELARAQRSTRDDVELMIRTEIGGLFAHLETRLEQRIEAVVKKRAEEPQ